MMVEIKESKVNHEEERLGIENGRRSRFEGPGSSESDEMED